MHKHLPLNDGASVCVHTNDRQRTLTAWDQAAKVAALQAVRGEEECSQVDGAAQPEYQSPMDNLCSFMAASRRNDTWKADLSLHACAHAAHLNALFHHRHRGAHPTSCLRPRYGSALACTFTAWHMTPLQAVGSRVQPRTSSKLIFLLQQFDACLTSKNSPTSRSLFLATAASTSCSCLAAACWLPSTASNHE